MDDPLTVQALEEESLGGLGEQEDDLDAFNDETFGGGDTWTEDQHEKVHNRMNWSP